VRCARWKAATLSNSAVERSKQRLQRLPFIEEGRGRDQPGPGTPDLVDVNYEIKEGLPGQFSGGIGYSESQSFLLNGSFVHSNFMGTGNRVAAEINAGAYSKVFSLSHTDPYTTIDGVSRTLSATFRQLDQFTSSSSDFQTETGTLAVDYGWPIIEFQSLATGLAAQRSDLFTDPNQMRLKRSSGSRTMATRTRKSATSACRPSATPTTARSSTRFDLSFGWAFDSRKPVDLRRPRRASPPECRFIPCRAATSSTTRSTTTTCSSCLVEVVSR
jgi:outer membrane protein insertion porin family